MDDDKATNQLQSTEAPIRLNELETRRFGVTCANVVPKNDGLPDIREINRAAQSADIQLLTVRIDAERLADVRAMEEAGFRLMDTLVYYGRSLETLPASVRVPEDTVVRRGTPEDSAAIAGIARDAFRDYMGHYHADPRLDDDAATEAYADWATRSLQSSPGAPNVIVAATGSAIMGFLTMRQNRSVEEEIVLNAVSPPAQGKGLYSAMLAHALTEKRGFGRMIVSTQINNYPVQRVWTRFGFVHERSYYTLHKWFD
jgi:GNAT superfamily N-acetyltransferase